MDLVGLNRYVVAARGHIHTIVTAGNGQVLKRRVIRIAQQEYPIPVSRLIVAILDGFGTCISGPCDGHSRILGPDGDVSIQCIGS